jgi:ABC-type multidrug transport system fused ATPase/permease subunit
MPLAADVERDRVVEALRRHYLLGRLTVEDLAERTESALAARTTSDLRLTLRDLPRVDELVARARRAVRTGAYLVLLAGLWVVGSLALLLSLAVLLVAGERSAAVLLAVPVLWMVLTVLVVRSGGRRLRRAA